MAAHGQNTKKLARSVAQELVKNKKKLAEVREALREKLKVDFLSSSLEHYLDLQYLKCALAHLEEDLKSHISDASIESITALTNELQEVSELSSVSSELVTSSTYYELINQALDKRRTHDNQEKVELFNKLKNRFIPDLIVRGDHLSEELEDGPAPSMQFVNALLDYLTDFKTQFLEDLQPSNILEKNVEPSERFELEWKSIFTRHYSRNAKEASEEHRQIVERLEDEKHRLTPRHREMFPEWAELIEQFAQEPVITTEKNGDRHTLIVAKPVIVLSKTLSAVEKYLKREWDEDEEEGPIIDEVKFHALNVFYVDTFLEKQTWHGRNIVVVSDKVWCVADDLSWDVSGADGENQALTDEPMSSAEGEREDGMQKKASTSSHEQIDGKHGIDGKNGESGGHVKIMAKEYRNMDRLQIHSNGGNGGLGGTGENGRDGVDGNCGNSMTLEELKNLFRSPLRFIGSKEELCIQVVSNIKQQNLKMTAKNFHGFREDGTMEERGLFPRRSIYLKGTFKNRVQYEFSFSQSPIERHTYLLLTGERGSLATQGGKGGFGGRGGGGGYPGTVEILDLFGNDSPKGKMSHVSTEIGKPGEPGRDGLDGKCGVSGMDGLDVGYLDAWNWPTVKYYEGAKYRLRTVKKKGKVWCDHCNAYRLIEKYQPDPLLPSLISRKHAHRRNMTVAVQKKTAIDTEKLLHISNRLQKDGITAQDFLSKRAKVNWTKASQSCVQAQQQQHQERSTVTEGIKLGIVKPANPIVSPTKPARKKKRNRSTISSNHLGLIRDVMMIDYMVEGQQEEIESYLEESGDFVEEQTIASKKMEVYVKQETIPGPDSPLHAIFGVKDDITQIVSVRSSIETREKVAEKLSKWFGSQHTFDLETKSVIETSLKDLYEAREHGDGEKIPKMQDLFGPKLQEFYEEYSKFAKRGSQFNWDMIEKSKPALRDYAMLRATPGIPFWPSDLVLIAKAHGLNLQYFEPAPNNEYLPRCPEVKSPIPKKVHPLASQFEQQKTETDTPAFLTVDKDGNYSKIVKETKVDWSQTEEVITGLLSIFDQDIKEKDENKIRDHFKIKLGQLFFEDNHTDFKHFEPIIANWPVSYLRLFFHFVFKHNAEIKDIASVKMAFLQISLALSRKEENVTPFLFVVVGFPVSQWARQFSLLLIQNLYGASRVSVYQSLIEETYPKEFLLQVVDLLTAATEAGEFYGAENEPKFEEFLQLIRDKYSPLGESWDYSCLNGMTSSNQWYHQLNKLQVMDKLKNIPGEIWDDEVNRFNQAFYYFHHLFENKPNEAKEMLEFYSNLKTKDRDADVSLTSILSRFYSGNWYLDEDTINILRRCQSFEEWTSKLDGDRNKSDRTWNLGEMIKRDETTFTEEQLNQLVFNLEKLKKPNKNWDVVEISKSAFESTMKEWLIKFKLNRSGPIMKKSYHKLVLAAIKMIDNVIRRFLKHGLRETQKLTALAALLGPYPEVIEDKNLLAQVKTGEGKSWIVLTVAIVRGLFNKKTDIVTSSSVLAQRDASEYRKIYEAFGLTVGHVTMENQAQRAREYQKTVVYGESTHFQRDYLIDLFYSQNVRGSRAFENVIIDEVDCMFLDKGNSVLYLSHTPPGMDTLEHILLFIWNNVVDGVNNGTFEPMILYEHILDTIYPRLDKSDIEDFPDPDSVIETLEKYSIIDNQDRLRLNLENIENLSRMAFTDEFDPHLLKKLINFKLKTKSDLHCPNFLKSFVELHLFTWIKSAYQATQLEEKMQYVLHVDRLNSDCEKHPKVVIIDLDTGVDLKESQWSDGLHQFLQIKHGCKLTSMNLKSVFVSNITFFNLYENIFGLTGTLGTSGDREFLRHTYGKNKQADILIVPTALPRRFTEEEPLLCSESTWSTRIIKDVEEKLNDGRSILILCETVKGAENLYGKIATELASILRRENAHLYRRDFEPFTVGAEDKNRLEPGTVIVATNLAGRGTDIKLAENLEARGGLHVIFSYLPNNTRVWWQGFGRAARCGDQGSGRLIFVSEEDDSSESESENTRANAVQNAIDYMMERDQLELSRVAEIRSFYDNVVQKEEDKFEEFGEHFKWFSETMDRAYKTVLDNLRSDNAEETHQKLISGQIEDIKELVKFSMLDDWAFWLDQFNRNLLSKSKSQPLNTKFQQMHKEEGIYLAKQFSKLADRYAEVAGKYMSTKTGTAFNYQVGLRDVPRIEKYATELIHEPALLTKLAKCYIFRKHYDRALYFLKKVADKEDPESLPATIAFYYTIFCRIQKNQIKEHDPFIQKVYHTMKTLEKLASLQLEIPNSIKRNQIVNNQKIWISEGLRRQKEAVAIILLEMRKSLEALVGKQGIQEHDFTDICNGHQDSAEFLIKDLLQQETIALPKIKAVFSECPNLQQLCQNYSLPVDYVENILNASRDQFLQPKLLKDLKSQLNLPSKSGFWAEIEEALEGHMEVAVILSPPDYSQDNFLPESNEFEFEVDLENAEEAEENETDEEKEEEEEEEKEIAVSIPQNYFKIWGMEGPSSEAPKYFMAKKNTPMSTMFNGKIIRGSKNSFMNNPEFLHFEKRGLAWFDTVAWLNPEVLRTMELENYYSISPEDFQIIPEVDEDMAQEIFQQCVNQDIFDSEGIPQKYQPSLRYNAIESPTSSSSIFKILQALETEITALIYVKSCYQLERLRILHEIGTHTPSKENLQQIEISNLATQPFKKFIFEAIDLGLIENTKVTIKKKPDTTKFAAEKGLSKSTLSFLEKLQNASTRPGSLLGTSSTSKSTLTRKDLSILFPNSDDSFIEKIHGNLAKCGWIRSDGKILLQLDTYGNPKSIACNSDIEKFLFPLILPVIRIRLSQSTTDADKLLQKSLQILQGAITSGTTDMSLHPLQAPKQSTNSSDISPLQVFSGFIDYQQELERFQSNGFDYVICGSDSFTSHQVLTSSYFTVLVMGTTQVLAGTILNVAPTDKAESMSPNMQDVIYSFLSLKAGKINWAEWAKYKVINLALGETTPKASIGKSLGSATGEDPQAASLLTSGKQQVLAQLIQQDFCNQFACHLERYVNILEGTLTTMFGTFVKERIGRNEPLEQTLALLLSPFERKKARLRFSECLRQAMEKTFEDHPVQDFISQMTDKLISDILSPSLKAMKSLNKQAFFDSEFSQIVSKAVSQLESSSDIFISISGLSQLVPNLLGNVETSIWDKIRKLTTPGTTQVQIDEKTLAVFVNDCRKELVQVMNERVSSLVMNKVAQPLLSHGMQKLFQVAGRQPKTVGQSQAKNDTDQRQEENEKKLKRAEFELESRRLQSFEASGGFFPDDERSEDEDDESESNDESVEDVDDEDEDYEDEDE